MPSVARSQVQGSRIAPHGVPVSTRRRPLLPTGSVAACGGCHPATGPDWPRCGACEPGPGTPRSWVQIPALTLCDAGSLGSPIRALVSPKDNAGTCPRLKLPAVKGVTDSSCPVTAVFSFSSRGYAAGKGATARSRGSSHSSPDAVSLSPEEAEEQHVSILFTSSVPELATTDRGHADLVHNLWHTAAYLLGWGWWRWPHLLSWPSQQGRAGATCLRSLSNVRLTLRWDRSDTRRAVWVGVRQMPITLLANRNRFFWKWK